MHRYNFLLPAFAAITLALAACSKDKEAAPTATAEEELPLIDIAVVAAEDVDQIREYTANVEAFNLNNISPSTPNRINTINVQIGDAVSQGQVLVTLDNSSATQLKVNLDQLERDYNRAVQLQKIGSGTQAAVDLALTQLEAARAQYNNVMQNTVLRSPVSGVVTARNYDPGDMTSSLPILTIGQITPNVKVIINITETDHGKVHVGMPVDVTVDAFPDEVFKGRISRIYPAVDPTTRTFQAEVLIPNTDRRLFPGMFARVTLSQGTERHVVVPDMAVVKMSGSGNRYVYVYSNGTVSYKRIETGQRMGDRYEIISGILDGDTVVIAGQSRLADGVKAQIKEKK